MKRSFKFILALVTSTSLALCVALGVIWLLSHRAGGMELWQSTDSGYLELRAGDGYIICTLDRRISGNGPPSYNSIRKFGIELTQAHEPPGCSEDAGLFRTNYQLCFVITLVFFMLAGISLPSGIGFVLLRRKPRQPLIPACAICGYDLRTTPDRCPDCGAVVPTHVKSGHP